MSMIETTIERLQKAIEVNEDAIKVLEALKSESESNEYKLVNPDGIPPIQRVFRELRILRDELKLNYVTRGSDVIIEAVQLLDSIADYDEPLVALINGTLTDDLDARQEALLRYLATEEA